MKPSNSRVRQDISHASRFALQEKSQANSNVSAKRKSQIEEKSSLDDEADSVELTSTIKTPRLQSKTQEIVNTRELFLNELASDHSADRANSAHDSIESNRSDESEISQESQTSVTLPSSEPRLVARTNNFILITSALTALSAPFVMILGPKDLASRAAWFGVGLSSGLIVGSAYCFGDYINALRDQVQTQKRGEISPA
jgi:hypothetical protein